MHLIAYSPCQFYDKDVVFSCLINLQQLFPISGQYMFSRLGHVPLKQVPGLLSLLEVENLSLL